MKFVNKYIYYRNLFYQYIRNKKELKYLSIMEPGAEDIELTDKTTLNNIIPYINYDKVLYRCHGEWIRFIENKQLWYGFIYDLRSYLYDKIEEYLMEYEHNELIIYNFIPRDRKAYEFKIEKELELCKSKLKKPLREINIDYFIDQNINNWFKDFNLPIVFIEEDKIDYDNDRIYILSNEYFDIPLVNIIKLENVKYMYTDNIYWKETMEKIIEQVKEEFLM